MSGFAPDHPGADVRVSPNFGPRIGVAGPDMIVLHYTGMETGTAAESWLCNPESQVSSHYLVHENGHVVQMVRECRPRLACGQELLAGHDRHQLVLDRHRDRQSRPCAWLPELSEAPGRSGHRPVSRHCRPACRASGAGAGAILVAPGRKVDPGERFPWRHLAAAGIGHIVAPRRAGGIPVLAAWRQGRGGRATAVDAVSLRLWRRYNRFLRRSDRRCGCSVSAAFPASGGSMAWPIDRRWIRCAVCSRHCLPSLAEPRVATVPENADGNILLSNVT